MTTPDEAAAVTDVGGGSTGAGEVEGRPSPAAAITAIEAALEAGRTVSLVGRCVVEPGEREQGAVDQPSHPRRFVLVKPDGATVVHGGEGAAPLHRFEPGEAVAATVEDSRLVLVVGPDTDRTTIELDHVDRVASFPLDADSSGSGAGSAALKPNHEDFTDRHGTLRERLLAEPDLVVPGFQPLSTERETAAGPIDLYGRDADGRAVVVEIKTDRAGPAAVGQLDRYVSALGRDLHADVTVRGVLVAPSATARTRRLLDERGFAFRALAAEPRE